MVKDNIKYNGIEYQLSTIYIEDKYTFETMIFPIENGVVSGNEVYKFRTLDAGESKYKHMEIHEHPERYLSIESINEYLKSKEELFMSDKLEFKEEDFTEDELMLLRLAFKLVDDVVEIQRTSNSDVYLCNELYNLIQKLGISNLVE